MTAVATATAERNSTMIESYYERWNVLYDAERRARQRARCDGKWENWRRAALRLREHENAHNA